MTIAARLLVGSLVCLAATLAAASADLKPPKDAASTLQALLGARLKTIRPDTVTTIGGEVLASPAVDRLFYQQRGYLPAWVTEDGPGRQLAELLTALEDLRREALNPEDYHLDLLKSLNHDLRSSGLLRENIRRELLLDLELLATDAFFTSAGHLLSGRIAPETLGPELKAVHKDADLIGALNTIVDSGRVRPVLNSFLPDHDGYRRLRRALERYRRIARQGDWAPVADGAALRVGREDIRVSMLRSRLVAEGYLDRSHGLGGNRLDSALKHAVEAFQRSHGQVVDGVVGPSTRSALNVSAQSRVRQIELNMERWRWLPLYLGKRYLLVNIADFQMEVVDGSRPVMVMRVAVGKDYRRTPVFSAELSKIVLNPFWYVPPTIFTEDLLPAIRENSDYLQQRGYKIFSSLGPDGEEVDPARIDWQAVDPKNFPYILRKDPGPYNPMGRAKFLFPNNYDVYIHDSPDPSIFSQPRRTFSSGCIRIEKPIELAEYLLKDDAYWSRRGIAAEIDSGRSRVIGDFDPLPIHIQYWTAWVDEDGQVQFREDIYGRDAVLEEALFKTQDF